MGKQVLAHALIKTVFALTDTDFLKQQVTLIFMPCSEWISYVKIIGTQTNHFMIFMPCGSCISKSRSLEMFKYFNNATFVATNEFT